MDILEKNEYCTEVLVVVDELLQQEDCIPYFFYLFHIFIWKNAVISAQQQANLFICRAYCFVHVDKVDQAILDFDRAFDLVPKLRETNRSLYVSVSCTNSLVPSFDGGSR